MLPHTISGKLEVHEKSGEQRTALIKKNIFLTFLIKGLSVLTGFLLLPLTIHYINASQYGIWIIISSLIAWINTFDIGLGHGLRNKLAHSLAINDDKNILKYISTTYVLLFLIASFIFILFLIIGYFCNWNELLNIQQTISYNINPIVLITVAFFSIQFILQPVNTILVAMHQPFGASLILLLGQILSLVLIFILQLYTTGNLLILVAVAAGSPIVVTLCATIYLFKNRLQSFTPKLRFANISIARGLLNKGSAFFLIQIGALILYETDNIIIARTLSAPYVTTFNIAFKYFSIITVLFSIIITPFWSAFTDAYAKKDFLWMRSSLKKMRMIWAIFSIFSLVLYFLSGFVYKVWIGNKIVIPGMLSFTMALYVMVQNWVGLHAYMLNGIGKLRVQLIIVIFASLINIPLSILLIHKIGLAGTVLANIILLFIISGFLSYQCSLVLNKRTSGIWDK